jgi:hypothetical protein
MLRPDLLALVAAQQHDKSELDRTCDDAISAAKGSAAGNTGTALHALTERLERGEDLGHIPEVLRADLDAYRACMERHNIAIEAVEQFVVCEALEAAGTLDRLGRIHDQLFVLDLKTGAGAVDYGLPSIAVQLAIYAHAETSWTAAGGHVAMPQVNHSRAYVIHLPAGTAHADLVEVDIVSGWQAAQTAKWVRSWRKRSDLGRSVTAAADEQAALREQIGFRIEALPPEAILALSTMVVDAGLPRVSKACGQDLADLDELVTFVEGEYEIPFEKPKRVRKK